MADLGVPGFGIDGVRWSGITAFGVHGRARRRPAHKTQRWRTCRICGVGEDLVVSTRSSYSVVGEDLVVLCPWSSGLGLHGASRRRNEELGVGRLHDGNRETGTESTQKRGTTGNVGKNGEQEHMTCIGKPHRRRTWKRRSRWGWTAASARARHGNGKGTGSSGHFVEHLAGGNGDSTTTRRQERGTGLHTRTGRGETEELASVLEATEGRPR